MPALPNSRAPKRGNCTTRTGAGRPLRDEAWSAHRRVGKQYHLLAWSPVWYARPNFDQISSVGRNDGGKRHAALDGAAVSRPRFATDRRVSPENLRVSPGRRISGEQPTMGRGEHLTIQAG